jgi:hypothetical protein
MSSRSIRIHREAPLKPALGDPCNGCGRCCALETCPAARVLLLQRRGPCRALVWQESESRYSCGLISVPTDYLRWLPAATVSVASRLLRRWIAAGIGCDADLAEE